MRNTRLLRPLEAGCVRIRAGELSARDMVRYRELVLARDARSRGDSQALRQVGPSVGISRARGGAVYRSGWVLVARGHEPHAVDGTLSALFSSVSALTESLLGRATFWERFVARHMAVGNRFIDRFIVTGWEGHDLPMYLFGGGAAVRWCGGERGATQVRRGRWARVALPHKAKSSAVNTGKSWIAGHSTSSVHCGGARARS